MNENNNKVKRKPTHININSNDAEPRHFDISLEQRCTDTGISPTYYNDQGDAITTSARKPCGSPVYDDSKRIFFPHHSSCDCKGSGVGCECTRTCSC
ncbi:unnamed protein product [Cunninghamella blakesleeana]